MSERKRRGPQASSLLWSRIMLVTSDKLLVEEKGVNSYKRLDDKQCQAGKLYWEKTKEYWTKVRKVWEDYTASHNTIELKTEINGKVLHDYLFDLAKDYESGKIKPADINEKIKTTVEQFIGHDKETAATHN